MAKFYFYYASMNAGKSTNLLQADFNYRERGMRTILWTAEVDHRSAGKPIASRIGLEADALRFTPETDLYAAVTAAHAEESVACVLIDEAQFLSRQQVWQCARLVDEARVPVVCYGLRTDFQGELFEGAGVLLGIADVLVELKGMCHCGNKATMNLRVDDDGQPLGEGEQTAIGGNERYVPLCRRHFAQSLQIHDD